MDKLAKITLNFKSDKKETHTKEGKTNEVFAEDSDENRKKHTILSYLFSLLSLDILM